MQPTLTNILNGLIPHPQDTTEGGDEFALSEGRPAGDYRLAEEILEDAPRVADAVTARWFGGRAALLKA